MESRETFVTWYAYAFLVIALLSLYLFFMSVMAAFPLPHQAFIIVNLLLYLLLGIGLLNRTRWAYRGLVLFLYVLFMAFPIGTAISYYSLRYARMHHVKDLFP